MGSFLVTEGEELLRSFRPHPLAFVGSYGRAFTWTLWGAIALAISLPINAQDGPLPYVILMAYAVLHNWLWVRRTGRHSIWLLHFLQIAIIATVLSADEAFQTSRPIIEPYTPFFLGLAFSVSSIGAREAYRRSSMTYLTTNRAVLRHGISPRTEKSVPLREIQEIRPAQGLLGSTFGFGRFDLVLGHQTVKVGGEKETVDVVLTIRGVPHFEEVRRDLHALLEEIRLPAGERLRRVEDRRLRDSMVRLAGWAPRERP